MKLEKQPIFETNYSMQKSLKSPLKDYALRFSAMVNLLIALAPACRPPINTVQLKYGSTVNYVEEAKKYCANVVETSADMDLITCTAKENYSPVEVQFSCYDQNLSEGIGAFLDQNNGKYSEVSCKIGAAKK